MLVYMAFPGEQPRELTSGTRWSACCVTLAPPDRRGGDFSKPRGAGLASLAVLLKQPDEWLSAPRVYFSVESMKKLYRREDMIPSGEVLRVPESQFFIVQTGTKLKPIELGYWVAIPEA